MKRITVKIITSASLHAQFVLEHSATGTKQTRKNALTAQFEVQKGEKYVMLIEVVGPNGSKYRIEITGATKATYPNGEIEISDDADIHFARITG